MYLRAVARTIHVRGVPDAVHAELRARAAAAGTSLSDYVLGELERVALRSTNAEVLVRTAQRNWSVSPASIQEMLDEARTER